jgi:hypothetical protein
MTSFSPKNDGWYFENFSEGDFTWDLFRESYLGVNPTENCVEAPLDCAFFELFKKTAQYGNCGGMSLLALALFKFGGFMGFCAPASQYFGGSDGPDRSDLKRAINILQARQFNVNGIRNIIELSQTNGINNAVKALGRVKELLAKGDYPVIVIANNLIGGDAHTLIAYDYEDNPNSTKFIHLWDPNNPYNLDPDHYDFSKPNPQCRLEIKGEQNWKYISGYFIPNKHDVIEYEGNNPNAWCFVVPMSLIIQKARHPMSVGMAIDAIRTLFITGSGSAIGQISDEKGRRFYSSESDSRISWGGLETDPVYRLPDCIKWPWFNAREIRSLPELYFLRPSRDNQSGLKIVLNGSSYKTVYGGGKDLITLESDEKGRGREEISLTNIGADSQSVEITTNLDERTLHLCQTRMDSAEKVWRTFTLQNIELTKKERISVEIIENFNSLVVLGKERNIPFDILIEQSQEGKIVRRREEGFKTTPGKIIKIRPGNWKKLKNTPINEEKIVGKNT